MDSSGNNFDNLPPHDQAEAEPQDAAVDLSGAQINGTQKPDSGMNSNHSAGSSMVFPDRPSMTPRSEDNSVCPPTSDTPSHGSGSASDTGNNGRPRRWNYEEQFRPVYVITSEPERKQFLDDLFSFLHEIGKPVSRLPIMNKRVLDLFELYRLVVDRGGVVEVINRKKWREIVNALRLPLTITSAAFTLRSQYVKYLFDYECAKLRLSTQKELDVAIDSNRRDVSRSSSIYAPPKPYPIQLFPNSPLYPYLDPTRAAAIMGPSPSMPMPGMSMSVPMPAGSMPLPGPSVPFLGVPVNMPMPGSLPYTGMPVSLPYSGINIWGQPYPYGFMPNGNGLLPATAINPQSLMPNGGGLLPGAAGQRQGSSSYFTQAYAAALFATGGLNSPVSLYSMGPPKRVDDIKAETKNSGRAETDIMESANAGEIDSQEEMIQSAPSSSASPGDVTTQPGPCSNPQSATPEEKATSSTSRQQDDDLQLSSHDDSTDSPETKRAKTDNEQYADSAQSGNLRHALRISKGESTLSMSFSQPEGTGTRRHVNIKMMMGEAVFSGTLWPEKQDNDDQPSVLSELQIGSPGHPTHLVPVQSDDVAQPSDLANEAVNADYPAATNGSAAGTFGTDHLVVGFPAANQDTPPAQNGPAPNNEAENGN